MATQERGVTVIEQPAEGGVVEWNLDAFPTDRFNRLLPTQTLSMPTDLFRPSISVVVADPPDREGKSADSYKSTDVPAGHRAPTARFLNKLATAAAVSFTNEHRIDDGTDPDVLGVSIDASIVLPTGQRITAPGSQTINLRTWFGANTSDAEKAKFRKQFYAHVSTRAKSRAIRGLLSLRSSYPEADLAKPFMVASFVPNMGHPEVRARILDAIAPVTAQLYGPAPAAKQLGSGPTEVKVAEAPEEDPAPATPPALPGEKLAKAELTTDEPDWLAKGAPAKPDLAATIRSYATSSGMRGKATKPQLEKLPTVFEGVERVGLGIELLFGPEARQELKASEANALIVAQESFADQATWAAAWTAMVDASASAAA